MQKVTKGYEPSDVLGFFEAISEIPRGSTNEKAVAEYIYNWGKDLGLDAYLDEFHNVVLKKTGSKGYENAAPVLLQGHTDIVCVKLPESDHDFEKDPLPLYIEDGKLRSKGTTLGADNGNAVAYMMGVLSRTDIVHPPLECVFTAAEEIGLLGANDLSADSFTAKRMINMDAGGLDDTASTVSCAGGYELKMKQKPVWTKAEGEFLALEIQGLQGGHSAGAISLGRGNAAKLMARAINEVSLSTPAVVCEFNGGDKMNAIISHTTAVIAVEDKKKALEILNKVKADLTDELRVTDKDFSLTVKDAPIKEKMLDKLQSKRLLQFIITIPATVRDMSFELKGHVLSSNNLGAVQVTADEIFVWTLARSGDDSRMYAIGQEIEALADVFGYSVEVGANFGGWRYNPQSKLRQTHKELFKKTFGKDIHEVATHGGLECGVFFTKEPEMDIITLGPKSEGAHTPEEYVLLDSFNETFNYLLLLLKTLAEEK